MRCAASSSRPADPTAPRPTPGAAPDTVTTADFDYQLPPERIAQHPLPQRSGSRMLLLPRAGGPPVCRQFTDFPGLLRPGDCLVINDTRVIPARLFGTKQPGGAKVEVLLAEQRKPGRWEAMLRPGRRLPPGTHVRVDGPDGLAFTVEARLENTFVIAFDPLPDLDAALARAGAMPLPPYIRRQAAEPDRRRYQTVYARETGAVAAPTAGLHFTPELLDTIRAAGVTVVPVTLHVGLGTFRPVEADNLADHVMHEERFALSAESATAINAARESGGRVVAVGTTSVRVLESCVGDDGWVAPASGRTRLFLHPPMRPRAVDGLLTNFHLPRSTLLMLVCTFAERERVLAAYRLAVREQFRFYSYGDCMVVL